ncbi:hypothetical protein [Neobacillus terrae]|nr:hypothetical protein [Neobacillus terrae]
MNQKITIIMIHLYTAQMNPEAKGDQNVGKLYKTFNRSAKN